MTYSGARKRAYEQHRRDVAKGKVSLYKVKPRRPGAVHAKRELLARAKNAPCADCGQFFPACVMDFDHRDPAQKVGHVGRMKFTASPEELEAEIAKCDLVCANCHRIRTWGGYAL